MSATTPRTKFTNLGHPGYHKMLWCLKISTRPEIDGHIERVKNEKQCAWKVWPPDPVGFYKEERLERQIQARKRIKATRS